MISEESINTYTDKERLRYRLETYVNKDIDCHRCSFNVYVNNFYKPYEPTCPFGYESCVNDPAYIRFYHPDRYKELYGELNPKEVAEQCERDDCNDDCYDEEDK